MKRATLASLLLVLSTIFPAASASASDLLPGPKSDVRAVAALLKIEFHVKAEHLPAFMKIMASVDTDMQSEAGFIGARVMVNADDRHRITLLEAWESRALHQRHFEAILANGAWQNILAMQASAPQMGYYTALEAD